MGNSQSFGQPVEHSRFSKVQYSLHNHSMIVREPILSKTKQLDSWLQKRKLLSHIYSSPELFICKQYEIEQKAACSDSVLFMGRYDGVFERTLQQQIRLRAQQMRHFSEEDIWYFTLLLAKNCAQIYEHGPNHFLGNIHPHNILLNRKGQYKLIVSNYSFSIPALLDHFKEYQLHGGSHAYLTPEIVGFLYSTKYAEYPNYPRCINKHTAEAFCLGVTLLSMATLTEQIGKLYKGCSGERRGSTMNNSVDSIGSLRSTKSKIMMTSLSCSSSSDRLVQLLQLVKIRYSGVLYQLILGLIEKDPQARLGIEKTYNELLRPIEREIVIFDSSWIQKVREKEHMGEQENLLKYSQQFCKKWARHQSSILKEE